MRWNVRLMGVLSSFAFAVQTATAMVPFSFSTGNPNGLIATASRPASTGKMEIESADDFVLGDGLTSIDHVTFTGLLTGGVMLSDIARVRIEIYRVFPKDSDTTRTPNVPTRTNSPSDVALQEADSADASLSFSASILSASFTANNSVLNGINKSPNQTTGGEGAVTGQEVLFDVVLNPAFSLPSDHYFFIPQVEVTGGEFFWLSAPKPIVSPGTPFAPDLQSWIRNEDLDPDWLRIGTDIVGGATPPTFNATFSLQGQVLADLSLAKQAPQTVAARDPFAYTLDVSNAAVSSTATNVVVTDTLPPGVLLKSATGVGWTCVESPPGTVKCTLASLAVGTIASEITLLVAPQFAGLFTNTATVNADQLDPNPEDNSASAVTKVGVAAPAMGHFSLAALGALLIGMGVVSLRATRHGFTARGRAQRPTPH